MILAHSDITELTYFTPIKVLFDDILKVTGATEIRILPPPHSRGREFNNQSNPARQPTPWSPPLPTPQTYGPDSTVGIDTPTSGCKRKDVDVESYGCEAKRLKHQNGIESKAHSESTMNPGADFLL
jgi:hypothetical protein